MADETFYLRIIAATGKFFSGKVRSVIIPQCDGEKEVLAHHEDMVIAVDDGELRFQEAGSSEWRRAVCGRGFIEITHNRATILVETCERPEDIDRVRAQAAKERAEEQLRQKQSIQEYYHSSAALSRAMARLKATRR
ncbi:MAG: ATP synthase F1 subunit epsilon [Lachnospiraceae bacterium]|nr:ATP synthase F1 subunit epsilon [Lachnospiraceae bacterium]